MRSVFGSDMPHSTAAGKGPGKHATAAGPSETTAAAAMPNQPVGRHVDSPDPSGSGRFRLIADAHDALQKYAQMYIFDIAIATISPKVPGTYA